MRQHVPLTSTPSQGEQGSEDFPHLSLARATSAGVLLGSWKYWAHKGPWLVRQIRGLRLPVKTFLAQIRAPLC